MYTCAVLSPIAGSQGDSVWRGRVLVFTMLYFSFLCDYGYRWRMSIFSPNAYSRCRLVPFDGLALGPSQPRGLLPLAGGPHGAQVYETATLSAKRGEIGQHLSTLGNVRVGEAWAILSLTVRDHRRGYLNLNGLPNEDDDPGNSDEPPSIRDDLPVDSGPVPVPEDDNDKDEDDDGSKSDSEDESDDEMEEEPELEGDDDDDDSGMDGGDDEDIDLFDDEGFLDV
ncbi:hypothetical protein B0H10DRAFT_1955640 [Mycena sp. CBHHK59/15]|nr:hypothetical protein B0H10DRAFT_1955640 [Mycena sp. CBHHK59/15]